MTTCSTRQITVDAGVCAQCTVPDCASVSWQIVSNCGEQSKPSVLPCFLGNGCRCFTLLCESPTVSCQSSLQDKQAVAVLYAAGAPCSFIYSGVRLHVMPGHLYVCSHITAKQPQHCINLRLVKGVHLCVSNECRVAGIMLACKAIACVALARPGVDMPCAGQHVADHCL